MPASPTKQERLLGPGEAALPPELLRRRLPNVLCVDMLAYICKVSFQFRAPTVISTSALRTCSSLDDFESSVPAGCCESASESDMPSAAAAHIVT